MLFLPVIFLSSYLLSHTALASEPVEKSLKHRHTFNYDVGSGKTSQEALEIIDIVQVFGGISKIPEATLAVSVEDVTMTARDAILKESSSDSQLPMRLEHDSRLEPNVSDKKTIVNLAKMTSDAYLEDPNNPNWFNTSFGFNFTQRFGWKEDGLRGHIFATQDNRMVVVSFKGTTIYPRGQLSDRDRINDVSLFSCCCGSQHPYYYSPVCNCSTSAYQCDSNCLTSAILQNETYYDAAIFVIESAMLTFPKATFWVVGHSLGGSIASLVGLSLNIPAISFEAPPERLPAQRIGLLPFGNSTKFHGASAYHFGNTADPVYIGTCQGYLSTCSLAGFAFETKCHSGKRCQYDTVGDKGWYVNIKNHRIDYVITNVLEAYDTVPNCTEVIDCVDCENWNFT